MKIFYSSLATRGLNRILYPFTDALNSRFKLPRFIIIAPDKDMITNIPTFKSSLTMGEGLSCIISTMSQLLQRRRQDLGDKRPGALAPDDHPSIVWIRMLKRPFIEGSEASKTFSLRTKFNNALEEQIRINKDIRHRIMSIDVRLNEFDRQGNLTNIGKNNFWREVDRAMGKFDLGDIKLLPRGMHLDADTSDASIPTNVSKENTSDFNAKITEPFRRFSDAVNTRHDDRKSPAARKRLWPTEHFNSPKRSKSRSHNRRSRSRSKSSGRTARRYDNHRHHHKRRSD